MRLFKQAHYLQIIPIVINRNIIDKLFRTNIASPNQHEYLLIISY